MKKLASVCVALSFVLGWHFQANFVSARSLETAEQEQVRNLIVALGSSSFAEREQAAKGLDAMGPLALDALRAAMKHQDSEISGRAARLVAVLEERILTSRMLAGKKLRLNVKNVSVFEAINELARLSENRLDVVGNRPALERKITLDTGEVTYWEALQQLCQKGGLTESTANVANTPQPYVRKSGIQPYYVQPVQPQRTIVALADGEAKQLPVCHQGSVRVVALPGEKATSGEVQILIDVSAETRLQDFGVVGAPFLSKIVDDRGQMLAVVDSATVLDAGLSPVKFAGNANFNGNVNGIMIVNGNVIQLGGPVSPVATAQRTVAVRVKLGDKGAKSLKEVTGKLSVQALDVPEVLVKVDRVLAAAGQSYMGKDGHAIHVQAVEKQDDGSYRIRLAVENPNIQDPFATRNIRFRNVNFNNGLGINNGTPVPMPKMVDAEGREFQPEILGQGTNLNTNNQVVQNAILVYRPTAEPAQLLLHGQRVVLFSVPFTLKNVPIQ
jgi:hypothetical protein